MEWGSQSKGRKGLQKKKKKRMLLNKVVLLKGWAWLYFKTNILTAWLLRWQQASYKNNLQKRSWFKAMIVDIIPVAYINANITV